jgi:hypothetical protein
MGAGLRLQPCDSGSRLGEAERHATRGRWLEGPRWPDGLSAGLCGLSLNRLSRPARRAAVRD